MSDEVIQLYIAEEIRQFSNAMNRCCKKLYGLVALKYRDLIQKIANNLQINMHISEHNGHDAIIIFKTNCTHITLDSMECNLALTTQTIKDMYNLHYYSDYMNSEKEIEMSKEFRHSKQSSTPTVVSYKFLGNQRKVITELNTQAYENFAKDCFLGPYKSRILNALQSSHVLIISSERKLDKAIAISMFIMEKCSLEKVPYKILLVEKDELIANYNSERLSRYFNENVGKTIGFQVQLQTRVGNSASIICTTSELLLRILMSESIMKCFEHITHVVVVDIHLHYAYTDLLLHELRAALKYHRHLKIILLSDSPNDNEKFLRYFGEGEVINLDENVPESKVFYLEHIYKLLPVKRLSHLATKTKTIVSHSEIINNALILDKCLEAYEKSPTDRNFDAIIYMFKGENASVNYRHSKSGRTALILASLLGRFEHMEVLLKLQADPCIADSNNVNAIKAAISTGNKQCCDLLNHLDKYQENNCMADDYDLIIDIIQMITTNQKRWHLGDIVVLLPSYDCLIRTQYYILHQKLLGNLPEAIVVQLLYQGMEREYLDVIVKPSENIVKIILATDQIESLHCIKNIRYVIDTGRIQRQCYNDITASNENTCNLASKRSLECRKHLIDCSDGDGICFRLMREDIFAELPENNEPDLLIMGLDRICLTVKLLKPAATVIKYFEETIVQPPMYRVLQFIGYLQKIGVLSETTQDVTWLGCRLIDIPVECSLGKLLVFSILMQCLDPILTIVSFMNTTDPFSLNHHHHHFIAFNKDSIRNKIKLRKLSYSEGISSDHFLYLRLYETWQNRLHEATNYHQYMVNGLMEYVSLRRAHLLRTLRTSQLVHNKGSLNMHYINLKSNCWSIVKAVLVAGMYPNICFIDSIRKRIKSPRKRELVLHPDSILRENELSLMENLYEGVKSTWMLYSGMSDSWHCNSLKFCTLVTPISIALFAGPMKISSSNIQLISPIHKNNATIEAKLHIDEWITFHTDVRQALLLLKTRQYFYSIYNNYLQFCSCTDYNQNTANFLEQNSVLEYIEKILTQEDKALDFVQPINIGFRPKVLPYKLRDTLDIGLNAAAIKSEMFLTKINNEADIYQGKEFYMAFLNNVEIAELDNPSTYEHCEWFLLLTNIIMKGNADKRKLKFFIITYSRNPNTLLKVLLGKWSNDQLNVRECHRGNILISNIVPLFDLVKNDALSALINRASRLSHIDNDLGEMLVNIFAFNIDGLLAET